MKPLTDVSNPNWNLEQSDWKSSSIISPALSLIITSILLLFWMNYTSLSLSLENIKLFAIVNWIFHVSDILILFISFKCGLILLRYSSTITVTFIFNVIVAPKLPILTGWKKSSLSLNRLLTFSLQIT